MVNPKLDKIVRALEIKPYYQGSDCLLYNADSLSVMPKLRGLIHAILTDPPYGINHDTNYTRLNGSGTRWDKPVANDNAAFVKRAVWMVLDMNVPSVIFGYNCFANILPCGTLLIWDKRNKAGFTGQMTSDAEVAWMNKGHGVWMFNHTWAGAIRDSERGTKFHPCQKPVALMRWCLQKLRPDGVLCDPFCGSGSVLLAALDAGIPVVGIEIDKGYCKTAVTRIEQHGQQGNLQTVAENA